MSKREATDQIDAAIGQSGGGVVRLTVNVSTPVADALKELASRHATTLTEEVRRAISVWKYLDDESLAGGKVLIETKDGRMREIVFGLAKPAKAL